MLREVSQQRSVEENRSINRELRESVDPKSASGIASQYCLDLADAVGGNTSSDHADDEQLEDLEALRDYLSKKQVRWVKVSDFAKIVDHQIGSLRNSRSKGLKTQDELFGRADDGYIWMQSKHKGHAKYLDLKDYPAETVIS